MIHFYWLTITKITKETNDCVVISFSIPQQLSKTFQYKQGQYITLRATINNTEVRRSYSLCSSPLNNDFSIAIKKVQDGLFSTYANDVLQVGDVVEVMPPMGKFFTALHSQQQKNYIGFAAGSGITPLLSIITTTLQVESKSTFTLVYGNKNSQSIIFKESLQALKDKYLQRFQLLTIFSQEQTDAAINFGRIDYFKCEKLFEKLLSINADEFFICGPEAMIFAIKNFLETRLVDEQKIHFELFTSTSTNIKKTSTNLFEQESISNITIKLDGRSLNFNVPFNSESILDAALQRGVNLPYACKGGVCCTCKAKIIEGTANMDITWGLENEEIEQGYILTCQAKPTSKKIVIDFDIK